MLLMSKSIAELKATRNVHIVTHYPCVTKFIANVQQLLMANDNSPFDAFPYTEYVVDIQIVACIVM